MANTVTEEQLFRIKSQRTVAPQILSNGDLPWAVVALPTTTSGFAAGGGQNQHGLQVGSWVVGYFLDGDSCQQPIVTGVLAGGPGVGTTGGGSNAGGTGDGGPASYPPGDREINAMKKLISIGFNEIQAAGIVGNLMVEAPGLNVGASGDSGSAHGLAQWRFDRWQGMVKFAQARGQNANDFNTQLEYIKYEMENSNPVVTGYASALLKNAQTPEDAASAFCNYEKPKGYRFVGIGQDGTKSVPSINQRRNNARQVFNKFKQTNTSTPVANSGGTVSV